MTDDKNRRSNQVTLSDLIDALEGVIGYKYPAKRFKGRTQARDLNLGETYWSSQKNGSAVVQNSTLSKLVDYFELGSFGLDYRLFQVETVEKFLSILRENGVGTYGANTSRRFRQNLMNIAHQSSGLRITIIAKPGSVKRSGVSFGMSNEDPVQIFRIGSSVRILCEGFRDCDLIVLNERLDGDISILRPSILSPKTFCTGDSIVIPDADPFSQENFVVQGPPGQHRLFAIKTGDKMVKILGTNPEFKFEAPAVLTNEVFTELVRMMDKDASSLNAAMCEYETRDAWI